MHISENRKLWVWGKMVFSALFHTTLEVLAALRNQPLLSGSCFLNSIEAQTYFQRSLNKNYATLCIEWNCFQAPFRLLKMKIQVGNDHYQNGLSIRDFIYVYLLVGKQSKNLPMTPQGEKIGQQVKLRSCAYDFKILKKKIPAGPKR